ncbi:hypothetical protein CDAR_377221 [Caerostris darwini]|uniref:Uncharacterized protein n=1 Tax=Caerostris darwini TaxID=1538125 RepID=A0AAV4WX00_9ARAC|nr:hypothetical protein CDAR_377221 [Caerostris darwini]
MRDDHCYFAIKTVGEFHDKYWSLAQLRKRSRKLPIFAKRPCILGSITLMDTSRQSQLRCWISSGLWVCPLFLGRFLVPSYPIFLPYHGGLLQRRTMHVEILGRVSVQSPEVVSCSLGSLKKNSTLSCLDVLLVAQCQIETQELLLGLIWLRYKLVSVSSFVRC